MSPPRYSVFIAQSLDGFIADEGGGVDWLKVVERPGEDYGYAAFAASVDTLVMGRKTYDLALTFPTWPYAAFRVVVLTHRPPAAARHGETFHTGPPAELAERLTAEGAKRVYVDGGDVIRQFLAAGLVDDVTLSLVPVLLGAGVPLFAGGPPRVMREAKVEEVRSFESGLAQVRFRLSPPSR